MHKPIKSILIWPNATNPNINELTTQVLKTFQKCGCKCLMDAAFENRFENVEYGNNSALVDECDAVLTVGGDGTILRYAKYAVAHKKPLLGVNAGRLGYLAQLEANELDFLSRLVRGDYQMHNRMLLEMRMEGQPVCYALNDVVVSRGYAHPVDLEVWGNGQHVGSYRADGLIFSTPTGSTAYALSAGGPIVDPAIQAILLTPICPHSLYARSILLDPQIKLEVRSKYINHPEKSIIYVDGTTVAQLDESNYVTICKSKDELCCIDFPEKQFYKLISQKFQANYQAGR